MSKLVLVRGLPGSGKSTFAKNNFPDFLHFEADQYFYIGEDYCFDGNEIKSAHHWCLWKTAKALEQGKNCVVANTFTQPWEIEKYLSLTKDISIYRMTTMYKNIHGVTDKVLEKMNNRFEDIDNEIHV